MPIIRLGHLKRRFGKRLQQSQQQVEGLSTLTEASIEKNLFGRFERLLPVRRFVIGWLLLIILLIGAVLTQLVLLNGYFQTYQPVAGGTYTEGVLGRFTTANPLFASSDVDSTVSRLVFSGLLTYNADNQLVGDLASSYTVDAAGTTYTFHLHPNLTWQDGQPLTSSDVVYTFKTIQNPDVQSPLQSSWQGITVAASNPSTVTFTLPTPLASFPYNLTTGIVPQHLLAQVPASDLRTADFNSVHPVGSGPFVWQGVAVNGTDPAMQQVQVTLLPFTKYHAGIPKLQAFVVRAFSDQNQLATALRTNQLTAAEGFTALPDQLKNDKALQQNNFILTAATMAFFKTSSGVLSDVSVRQALTQATNTSAVLAKLGYPTRAVREPLLTSQLAYDQSLVQASFNLSKAKALLDQDNWKLGANGLRTRDGKTLRFVLSASDTPEYRTVATLLASQWRQVGVDVQIAFQNSDSLQSMLASHGYDALLYGISIGIDPDVFAYWDSSQADVRSTNRLNLSEYKNDIADAALQAGRTRLNPQLRVLKYKPFLQVWQQDAPAVGLYQPRVLYLTNGSVSGLTTHEINSAADRFANVQNWEVKQVRVTNSKA